MPKGRVGNVQKEGVLTTQFTSCLVNYGKQGRPLDPFQHTNRNAMGFAILRTAKLTTAGNIGGLNAHLTRTMEVPNADPALAYANSRPIGTADLWRDVQQRIEQSGAKVRKNSVLAVEHLITASPELFNYHVKETEGKKKLYGNVEAWREFEKSAQKWLIERYGKENVVNFTVHKDESSPHIHAVVVPILEGKLNCRAFLGGRQKLSEMQTSFAKSVEHIGIKRGIEGSKAKHMDIKDFHGMAKEAKKPLQNTFQGIKIPQVEPIRISEPPLLNRSEWKAKTEAEINQRLQQQLEQQRVLLEKQYQEKTRAIKTEAEKSILRAFNGVLEKREAKSLLQKENALKDKYEGKNGLLEHIVKRMEQVLASLGVKYNPQKDTVEKLSNQQIEPQRNRNGISR